MDGGQRIGDRQFGVVMGMDAQREGNGFLDGTDDFGDLTGQGSPVGVAENDGSDLGFLGRLESSQRVFRIALKPVKKMFGVVINLRNDRSQEF